MPRLIALATLLAFASLTLAGKYNPTLSIGDPFGVDRTLTSGIVSALQHQIQAADGRTINNVIQIDQTIDAGNSGGPLYNLDGDVIGVNTFAIHQSGDGRYADGLGFAVTSETIQQIVTLLIADGRVSRPYLGVSYIELNPQVAIWEGSPFDYGILVTNAPSGGPARESGIVEGDIVTSINGQAIDREHPFVNLLYQLRPGDTIEVGVFRLTTEETLTFQLTLEERDE